jgi:hypothetical protein
LISYLDILNPRKLFQSLTLHSLSLCSNPLAYGYTISSSGDSSESHKRLLQIFFIARTRNPLLGVELEPFKPEIESNAVLATWTFGVKWINARPTNGVITAYLSTEQPPLTMLVDHTSCLFWQLTTLLAEPMPLTMLFNDTLGAPKRYFGAGMAGTPAG